jgi:hypothetical protein
MSANFMFVIAALYLAAFVGFFIEGRFIWALIVFCWALSNAALGLLSIK